MKPQPGTPQDYDGFCKSCGGYIQTQTCYTCKHLATNEDPDQWRFYGSDVTPPDEFKIFCKLEHWAYYEGPIKELRDGLLKAHDCPDYNPIHELTQSQQPIEDYVGHIYRPPYCNKCHSNLVVKASVLDTYANVITQYASFCPTCHPTLRVHPVLQGVAYYDI